EGDGEVASYSLAFDAGMRLIVSAIAFSPDGSQLAYALNSGEVTAMDLESGTVKTLVQEGPSASALIWPDHSLVAIVDSEVRRIPADGESEVESIAVLPFAPDHFSVSANQLRLLVASRDSKSVAVVDLHGKNVLHLVPQTL
ncbi:MAG: TolB family protein, partial [Planctomycetaceae bacterium]